MFQLGSKVVVIASNMKSNTSPRRGSLGYPFNLSNTSIYMPSGGKLLIKPFDVMFTRYGYETEKKQRFEVKHVFVPTLLNHKNTSIKDLETVVDDRSIREKIGNDIGTDADNIILAFLAPVDNFDVKTDFISWLMVHILDERNTHMFDSILSNQSETHPKLFEKINHNTCEHILNWANHKDGRLDNIRDFLDDSQENKGRLLSTIIMIKTIWNMRRRLDMESHPPNDSKQLLSLLIHSLFIPSNIEFLLQSQNMGMDIGRIRDDMNNIRAGLFSFARSSMIAS
jgi:hypothetical protein